MVPAEDDEGRPDAGDPVRVEVRDTSLADAPSRLVAAADTVLERAGGRLVATATLVVDDDEVTPGADLTVWARCRPSSGPDRGRVSPGDWITMESYPLRPARRRAGGGVVEATEVTVRRVS